jgi:hypothetical protein
VGITRSKVFVLMGQSSKNGELSIAMFDGR